MTNISSVNQLRAGRPTTSLLAGQAKERNDQSSLFATVLAGQTNSPAEQLVAPNVEQEEAANLLASQEPTEDVLWDKFKEFVGNTLFGQTLASMRKTLGKPAYFHGGQTEEIFQQQLDQHLVKHITESSADTFVRPMYEHFKQDRNLVDVQA